MPTLPAWNRSAVPALGIDEFQNEIERLEARVIALEAVAARRPAGSAALSEVVLMTDAARDLAQSLKTVCRARQSINVTDTLANAWRVGVNRLNVRLEKAAEQISEAVYALPEDARREPPLSVWCSTFLNAPKRPSPLMAAMVLPLSAQHAHLTSTMKLRVPSEDGHLLNMSYTQATALIKTSDDTRLRRAVFGLYSAWFAEHAPAFADLLNALLGWKLYEADSRGQDFMMHSLAIERLSPAAYEAMTRALGARLEEARRTVTERAAWLGCKRLHVTQILSSMPDTTAETPQGLRTLDELLASLADATKPADPAFGQFLERAVAENWIDAQQQSGRAGGTWCEDLPAFDAVAIFANYVANTAGAFQFAHPCGVGFLHQALHKEQAPLKRLPFSMIEIFGQLPDTMLERMMIDRLAGTPAEAVIRWQIMRRASNHLLVIPSRHRLLVKLYQARRSGVLSVSDINALSGEAWRELMGDAVDGHDQYVWCWKPHFYRYNVNFYDWQYTFGYLVSQCLADRFLADGCTAARANLSAFAKDASRMDCDALLRKHLDADIRSRDFWEKAIDTALRNARLGSL